MDRYQVFFCMEDNICNNGVADITADYLEEFRKGKIITKIVPYKDGNAPHQRHEEKDEDLDYDKSMHRCR